MVAIEYQPSGKRPRGRSRKPWFDGIGQDLRSLNVEDLSETVQDGER